MRMATVIVEDGYDGEGGEDDEQMRLDEVEEDELVDTDYGPDGHAVS